MHKIMTCAAAGATLLMLSFSTPASAATVQKSDGLKNGAAVSVTTDLSARRYHRRYYRGYRGYYRPYYYGPRPYYGYGYGYARPYYRPYYAPPPFPFFGFPFF